MAYILKNDSLTYRRHSRELYKVKLSTMFKATLIAFLLFLPLSVFSADNVIEEHTEHFLTGDTYSYEYTANGLEVTFDLDFNEEPDQIEYMLFWDNTTANTGQTVNIDWEIHPNRNDTITSADTCSMATAINNYTRWGTIGSDSCANDQTQCTDVATGTYSGTYGGGTGIGISFFRGQPSSPGADGVCTFYISSYEVDGVEYIDEFSSPEATSTETILLPPTVDVNLLAITTCSGFLTFSVCIYEYSTSTAISTEV